jgi:hypothetical protein
VIGEDNTAIKFSERQQMTMLISEDFTEIQGVINRLYLLSTKDPDIKTRRDVINQKANALWSMLTEQRNNRSKIMVKAGRISNPAIAKKEDLRTTALTRSSEVKNKRKDISPLEGRC